MTEKTDEETKEFLEEDDQKRSPLEALKSKKTLLTLSGIGTLGLVGLLFFSLQGSDPLHPQSDLSAVQTEDDPEKDSEDGEMLDSETGVESAENQEQIPSEILKDRGYQGPEYLDADPEVETAEAITPKILTEKEIAAGVLPQRSPGSLQQQADKAFNGSNLKTKGMSANPEVSKSFNRGSQLATTSQLAQEASGGCYTISFKQKTSGNDSAEVYAYRRNLIKLPGHTINKKSICMRINGTPVKYRLTKGKSTRVLIGAVSGPETVVSATYCMKKSNCSESCAIPRDEFMAAIGGGDHDLDAPLPDIAWEADKVRKVGKHEKQLDKELSSFKAALAGTHSHQSNIFTGWVRKGQRASCWKKTASIVQGGSRTIAKSNNRAR